MLTKIHLQQIIPMSELACFAQNLRSHQLATDSLAHPVLYPPYENDTGALGPQTVFERGIMEHNLLSASKIYLNMTYAGLRDLLSLSIPGAEDVARVMILQGRLQATLDQSREIITFVSAGASDDNLLSQSAVDDPPEDMLDTEPRDVSLKDWDSRNYSIVKALDVLSASIKLLHIK